MSTIGIKLKYELQSFILQSYLYFIAFAIPNYK